MVIFNPWIRFEAVDAVPLGSGEPRFTGRLWISHPGTWAGVRLTLPDESVVTLVSGYGLFDDRHPTERGLVYSTTTVNRMLSDLTPLIDSDAGRRMIIAGDLNVGTQYKDPSPEEPHRHGPHHRATFERFGALGMVDCLAAGVASDRGPLAGCACGPAPECRHVRTYRHDDQPNGHPGQIDVIFATRALVKSMVTCVAVDDEQAWKLSDHYPVVAEFEV